MITDYSDTIVALATAMGEGAVHIIRLSGTRSIEIASCFCHPDGKDRFEALQNRKLAYGWVKKDGEYLDEVLFCTMRKPKSFTVEDIVEIHCHGGTYIAKTILDLALAHGARLANPGEFTQRAFLNGRIDLTQAEAVQDMIQVKGEQGLKQAINQLKGKLFEKIQDLKEKLSSLLALVNASIDFSEEDLLFADRERISKGLLDARQTLESLINGADSGIIIRDGLKIVLAGEPNVGKSSILNKLLGNSRAIVTDLPGTTRDTIEESFILNGVSISIIDTAGVRETNDMIEKEGIERTLKAISKADLVLWVIDLTNPIVDDQLSRFLLTQEVEKLIVFNKSDCSTLREVALPQPWASFQRISISAFRDEEIIMLKSRIYDYINSTKNIAHETATLTNLRQKNAAEDALQQIYHAEKTLNSGMGHEFLANDFSGTLRALGDIVGETTPDDMLNKIFSGFCIGK